MWLFVAEMKYILFSWYILAISYQVNGDICNNATESYKICKAVGNMIRNQNVCDSNRIQVMQRRIQVLTGALNQLTIQQRRGECQGVVYRNRCYFLLDDGCEPNMLTHQGAQAACGAQQGHLVRITNDMQYNFLFNYVLRNAYDFMAENREFVLVWTDARWDFQHGLLRFSNNDTTSYKTWNLGHPINMTERSHVAMAVASRPILRGMIDVPPTTQFYPLCEKTMRCRYGKRSH